MTGQVPALAAAGAVALATVLGLPRAVPPRLRAALRPATGSRPAAGRVAGTRAVWAGRVRPTAARRGLPTALLLDLIAAALDGGSPPARAVAAVAEALDVVQDPAAAELASLAARLTGGARPDGVGAGPVTAQLGAALELAVVTGMGPAELIRIAAQEERLRRSAAAVQAARRLAVLVLLPTGLCLLPAFVLLTVFPLVLDLLAG